MPRRARAPAKATSAPNPPAKATAIGPSRCTLADAAIGDFITMTDGSVVRLCAVINGGRFVRPDAGAGDLEERPASTPILDSRAPTARAADTAPVHDPLAGASDSGPDLFHSEDA